MCTNANAFMTWSEWKLSLEAYIGCWEYATRSKWKWIEIPRKRTKVTIFVLSAQCALNSFTHPIHRWIHFRTNFPTCHNLLWFFTKIQMKIHNYVTNDAYYCLISTVCVTKCRCICAFSIEVFDHCGVRIFARLTQYDVLAVASITFWYSDSVHSLKHIRFDLKYSYDAFSAIFVSIL